ncbi:site-2 protease family protein, partial [Intestinimonas sp.]
MNWAGLIDLLLSVAAILLCLTVHETCHGLAAWALGDPTAKRLHRLSLNPLRHIDPFGALMMLVAGFGWAKPVPVDPRYFRNPKSGMAVTALAGPLSNLLMAYLALLLRAVLLAFYRPGAVVLEGAVGFCETLAVLNVGLGLFNLIPFPPLDGSKVLGAFLPDR